MALGARSADVLQMVIANSVKLAAGGLAVGVPVAIVIMRVLASVLVGVVRLDIPVLVGLTALLRRWPVMCPHAARPALIRSPPCTASDPPHGNAKSRGARIGRPFPSLGDEFHDEFPLARPVEFTKEDALPAAQC